MTDPITNTAFLVKLLTETSTAVARTAVAFRSWCMTALGPLVFSIIIASCFLLFSTRQYAALEEMKNDNAFRRSERGKNNDLKRKALWDLVVQPEIDALRDRKARTEQIGERSLEDHLRREEGALEDRGMPMMGLLDPQGLPRVKEEEPHRPKGGEDSASSMKTSHCQTSRQLLKPTDLDDELDIVSKLGRSREISRSSIPETSERRDGVMDATIHGFFGSLDAHCI